MSDKSTLDTNKLSTLKTLLERVSDRVELLGSPSINRGKGVWEPGVGLLGDLDKARGLQRWVNTAAGQQRLAEQARENGRAVSDEVVKVRLKFMKNEKALREQVAEMHKELEVAKRALSAWLSDNPAYNGLNIDDVSELLEDPEGEAPRMVNEAMQVAETEHHNDELLSNILNGNV